MPIDPRRQPITAEARQTDRLATLERRLAAEERRSLNAVVQRRMYAEGVAEVTTTSATFVDLGGPTQIVTVGSNEFIALVLEAELRATGGGSAIIGVSIDGGVASAALSGSSATYETRRATPGSGGGDPVLGGRFTIPVPEGAHTVSLRYRSGSGTDTFFRNRRMWIEVI